MDGHFITKCSCGAIMDQCRCPGPKTETVIKNGCAACQTAGTKPEPIPEVSASQVEPESIRPASELSDAVLLETTLEVYARSLMYVNSEAMHNRSVELQTELAKRLAHPQPEGVAAPAAKIDKGELFERVEKFYDFLQGRGFDSITVQHPPRLSADEAFAIIYVLQEGLYLIPDHFEQCLACGRLFDAHSEGHYEDEVGHVCDGCDVSDLPAAAPSPPPPARIAEAQTRMDSVQRLEVLWSDDAVRAYNLGAEDARLLGATALEPQRLQEIRERLEAITEPWHLYDRGIGFEIHRGEVCSDLEPDGAGTCLELNMNDKGTFRKFDATLIAHAPSDIRYLLELATPALREGEAVQKLADNIADRLSTNGCLRQADSVRDEHEISIVASIIRDAIFDAAEKAHTTPPAGYWPTLVDHGDGVKGHYCIGRKMDMDKPYWEFWNKGAWVSAGEVFIGRQIAQKALDRLRTTTTPDPQRIAEAARRAAERIIEADISSTKLIVAIITEELGRGELDG